MNKKLLAFRSISALALILLAAPFCKTKTVQADCGPCNGGLCFGQNKDVCNEIDTPPYCVDNPNAACHVQ